MITATFPSQEPSRVIYLRTLRETLVSYLRAKTDDADWHGVADAAMDLREIEAELKGLEHG